MLADDSFLTVIVAVSFTVVVLVLWIALTQVRLGPAQTESGRHHRSLSGRFVTGVRGVLLGSGRLLEEAR